MATVPTSTLMRDQRPTIDWSELETLVPTSGVSDAPAQRLVSPDSVEQVSSVLAWANRAGALVSVQGNGTKQRWGNCGSVHDLLLSTEKMSRWVEHAWDDLTFTVQAGMKVADVQAELAKHGQRLALDPLWPERSTIGGVVASNDSGTLRLRYGSVRDLILGVTVVLANGTIARSGGKVVKNVAGYDLPKLLTGSMGTLAVITEATFRAHPLPKTSRTLTFHFADIPSANRFMLAVNDSPLVPSSMQLRAAFGSQPLVDIRFDGIQAGIDAQTATVVSLAAGANHEEASQDIWRSRELLFEGDGNRLVAKLSVLPSKIADTCAAAAKNFVRATIVIQATGLGLIRGEADSTEQLSSSLAALRESVRHLAGTMVLLDAPNELRAATDVYGPASDAYPLMARVKQRFDPNGILNRGRFAGGI